MTRPADRAAAVRRGGQRPPRPPQGDAGRRRRACGVAGAARQRWRLSGALRLWHMMVIVAVYGGAQAFFDPASDAILPELLPAVAAGRGQRAGAVRAPAGAAPRRARRWEECWSARSARARRSWRTAPTFMVSAAALWSMSSRARPCAATPPRRRCAATTRRRPRAARGLVVCARVTSGCGARSRARASPTCCSWAPPRCCCPSWSSTCWAAAALQLGLVLGAGGLGSVACALAMTRSGLPSRGITFIYVGVGARHGGGRGLRPGHRDVAADAGEPRLQSPGDGGHDRVGDDQAAPRPRRAARARVEPRLADLDRAAAGVASR